VGSATSSSTSIGAVYADLPTVMDGGVPLRNRPHQRLLIGQIVEVAPHLAGIGPLDIRTDHQHRLRVGVGLADSSRDIRQPWPGDEDADTGRSA
jgi:hypothetical protein